MSEVEYRDIPGFPGYRAGSDGTIWSSYGRGPYTNMVMDWKKLKSYTKSTGKAYITLLQNNKNKTMTVVEVVMLAFSIKRPDGTFIYNIDGNINNNSIENVVYGTAIENAQDKFLHGTSIRGKNNPRVKLTETEVIEIKEKLKTNKVTHIAKEYGVGTNTITSIRDNKTWNYI